MTSAASTDDDFLPVSQGPMAQFHAWLDDARKAEPNDPDAMALATVDDRGMPDVRMVLLKAADDAGFVFYTNSESAKGIELAANPCAALCFHWKSLRRQVRVRGLVSRVADAEADAYFASRPRDSQIGAWASAQSRPMEGRFVFERAIAAAAARFGLSLVPRPSHWRGYRIAPIQIEFWRDRPFRLHDRIVYRRADPAAAWDVPQRLFP